MGETAYLIYQPAAGSVWPMPLLSEANTSGDPASPLPPVAPNSTAAAAIRNPEKNRVMATV